MNKVRYKSIYSYIYTRRWTYIHIPLNNIPMRYKLTFLGHFSSYCITRGWKKIIKNLRLFYQEYTEELWSSLWFSYFMNNSLSPFLNILHIQICISNLLSCFYYLLLSISKLYFKIFLYRITYFNCCFRPFKNLIWIWLELFIIKPI